MKIRRDGSGIHFFERTTGVNVLFDEIRVPTDQRDVAPRFVSLALTNACDLHCAFCYAPKHPARLDAATVVAWARELDRGGCLGVGFGVGEPTLYPRFAPLCQEIAATTELAVSFTTHGHHLTPSLSKELKGAVHFVRVSIDGVDKTYAQIRGRPFSALLAQLAIIRGIAPFGVNYVVNAATINDLDVAAAIAFENGASELLLLPERPVRGVGGIDEPTRRQLIAWIQQNQCYRLAISDTTPLEGVPIAQMFHDRMPLEGYVHIDAAGNLRPSSYSDDRIPISGTIASALSLLRRHLGYPS